MKWFNSNMPEKLLLFADELQALNKEDAYRLVH